MLWYGFPLTWCFALLPAFVALATPASLGPAFPTTALNIRRRYFRYVIPFILQSGLSISPIGFSSAIVPDRWRFWYSLNSMVGIIDGFRQCVLGGGSPLYLPAFFCSALPSSRCFCGSASAPAHRAQLRRSHLISHERAKRRSRHHRTSRRRDIRIGYDLPVCGERFPDGASLRY
jgi:hypothetical protein